MLTKHHRWCTSTPLMLLFLIRLLQLLITIMMNWGTHDKIRGASHVLEGRTSSSSSSALHMHFVDEVLGALLYPRALFLDVLFAFFRITTTRITKSQSSPFSRSLMVHWSFSTLGVLLGMLIFITWSNEEGGEEAPTLYEEIQCW